MNTKIKTVISVLPVIFTAACSQQYPNMFEDGSHGRVLISADAEGMRAYNDGINALVTNGKASPDSMTPAWHSRDNQEGEITSRILGKIKKAWHEATSGLPAQKDGAGS